MYRWLNQVATIWEKNLTQRRYGFLINALVNKLPQRIFGNIPSCIFTTATSQESINSMVNPRHLIVFIIEHIYSSADLSCSWAERASSWALSNWRAVKSLYMWDNRSCSIASASNLEASLGEWIASRDTWRFMKISYKIKFLKNSIRPLEWSSHAKPLILQFWGRS